MNKHHWCPVPCFYLKILNSILRRSLVEAVRLAVEGGATIVQIREKDAGGGNLLQVAREVLQVCAPGNK